MNFLQRLNAMRSAQPRKRMNSDEKRPTFHLRKLYRGLTVPWSNVPGRKRINPKQQKKG